jgi:N6-adenosine-specific RNA methylase IME4
MAGPWPFGALMPSKYGVILLDAAWLFELWSAKGKGKSAGRHYRCMTMAELKALPVNSLAAPDCALVMWGVWSMLPQALDLMKG